MSAPDKPDIHVRGGTWDQAIFQNVVSGEYGPLDFAGRTVVDIGAHIGAFSVLAAMQGARRVIAFEAGAANVELLRRNCARFPAIECRHAAVWRSDRPAAPIAWRRSAHPENTGGGSVLACESVAGYGIADDEVHPVVAVALDDVLREAGSVDVVKIDAEGSEYPILLTSCELGRVRAIVGEYHEVVGLAPAEAIAGVPAWTIDALAQRLGALGFEVTLKRQARAGWFRATRPGVTAPVR